MSSTSASTKTPVKAVPEDQAYELPDTPTSLASSYNKDVIYNPASNRNSNASPRNERNLNDEITHIVSKKMQYNALHDSIESFNSQPHNSSILEDFHDIKAMMDAKHKPPSSSTPRAPLQSTAKATHKEEQQVEQEQEQKKKKQDENEKDVIQKWLQDRKRWELIQQTYEQKVVELHKSLQTKSAHFEQKLAEMASKENKYKKEIKTLHHQIENIHSAHTKDSGQHKQLEQEYRKLYESNVELHAKYQSTQQKLTEKTELSQQLEMENKRLQQSNRSLSEQMEAIHRRSDRGESELQSKITQLTEQVNEAKHENERLKQLELTSQNMVERLLKRLEQQIHSAEATQQQLNLNKKQHDEEILKLEQINSKLQKNLVALNAHHGNAEQRKVPVLSSCSSDSSIFTLSTVVTNTNNNNKGSKDHRGVAIDATPIRDHKANTKQTQQLQSDLEAMKEENESLKEIIKSFEQMLNLSPNGSAQPATDRHEEWMKRTKQMAKQSVLVEKLKNEIVHKDARIREFERFVTEHKEAVNALEITAKQQRNSISLLEKTNSEISLELIEERSLRQRLEKDIEDLQFENKQLRNKLIAFKNFASQTQIGVVYNHQSAATDSNVDDSVHIGDEGGKENSNPNQQQHPFLAEDVFERAEQVSMGRPSDANTIHLRSSGNGNNNSHKDQLLLDGLRHLIDRYASQHTQQPQPPQNEEETAALPHSAPNTADSQRRNRKTPKRVIQSAGPKKADKLKTPNKRKMVEKGDVVHDSQLHGLWKSSNRKTPKNRHRIPCMTPVSYMHDHDGENAASSMGRKVKSSKNVHKIRNRSVSDPNKVKVIRITKPKKASPCFPIKAKVNSNNINKRKKYLRSASKRAMLHPSARPKHWV